MDARDWSEERVMRFTERHWPVRKGRSLTADTRLAQDLGVDGEDAVEFFDAFQKEFGIDLEDLHIHWDQHFSPEGTLSLGALIMIVLCITAGFWVKDAVGIFPAWAWGLLLIAMAALIYQRLTKDDRLPVTLGDMAESVRAGRWSKPYFGNC
jgi:acyl carrier protein